MLKINVTDFPLFLFLCIVVMVAANNSEHTHHVNDHVILRCPVLQEVIREDGAFDIAYWSVCKSKHCDHQDVTWLWLAGMNREGMTKVRTERFSIMKEGNLKIRSIRVNDAGEYMCTVKRINYASPRRHFATFAVLPVGIIDQSREVTSKPSPRHCNEEYPKDNRCLAYQLIMLLLFVLLVLAVLYIVYIKRTGSRGNQENSV